MGADAGPSGPGGGFEMTHRVLWAVVSFVAPALAGDCAGLAKLSLPATTITIAEEVTAGAFQPPGGQGLKGLPAFCRVAGVIKPSSDSDIRFEA